MITFFILSNVTNNSCSTSINVIKLRVNVSTFHRKLREKKGEETLTYHCNKNMSDGSERIKYFF